MYIGIIGVGYVGENLLTAFSEKFNVIGYDISLERIKELQNKYKNYSNISLQNTTENLYQCKLFCITVPTLINTEKEIDLHNIQEAMEIIENVAQRESIIVIESSGYVGMARELLSDVRKKGIYVGVSPERVDPGRTTPKFTDIEKIVSGFDDESLEEIKKIYSQVFSKLIPVSSMETAEMCKLVENCFRMVNIAYTNEIYDICKNKNINPFELINACSTKPFGFMPFYPSLGVGGHCIPINPFWLAKNNTIPFLMHATNLMLNRPIEEAKKIIADENIKNVLVVGIGFKTGESAITNSPSIIYASKLQKAGKNITLYDPIINKNESQLQNYNLLDDKCWNSEYLDKNFDLIIIAIKQKNISWDVLKLCKKCQIIKYCDV